MIDPEYFYEALASRGIGLYAGVPDSLLANLCAYIDDHGDFTPHLITANEGNAVAVALGYHMATGKAAVVYMQNSGLGNAINPLCSLADADVYRVPMLLVIGWRGEPGIKDEPQHVKQGRITLQQLDVLGIPYQILEANSDVNSVLDSSFAEMSRTNAPVALVVRKDTFGKYQSKKVVESPSRLRREEALRCILDLCDAKDLIVSTTGKTSRELFDLRVARGDQQRDFLTVGGMGHTASIALGVASGQPDRRLVCLDGDGSLLMHMGAMPVIAGVGPRRFVHVLLNNGAHESVGGQATAAGRIDFKKLADAVGYSAYANANDIYSLSASWEQLSLSDGPVLLELKILCGSRDDLGRPTSTTEENKMAFMEAARG